MIREARIEDIPTMVPLAHYMHAESNFASVPLSEPHVIRFMAALIESENGLLLVADGPEGIEGGIFASLVPAWFGNGKDMMAEEIALFVAPNARGRGAAVELVAAFRQWAERCGALQIRAGTAAGAAGQAAGRIYEALGFERTGSTYLFDLAKHAQHAMA